MQEAVQEPPSLPSLIIKPRLVGRRQLLGPCLPVKQIIANCEALGLFAANAS